MSRLTWDVVGEHLFQVGIDRGVLYLPSQPGVPWSGLTSVDENPKGGDPRPFYLDGVKYLNLPGTEEFEATIKAYTYPDEFAVCDGTVDVRPGLQLTQQRRVPFGFSYRTLVGNDVVGAELGYKIHIVYNALAAPSSRNNESISDSVSPQVFSWDITTCPPAMTGYRRASHVIIDSLETEPEHLALIEDILYGTDMEAARIPTLDELIVVYDTDLGFTVTDNGDGTWTATGSSAYITMLTSEIFQIDVSTAVVVDADTYTLSTL